MVVLPPAQSSRTTCFNIPSLPEPHTCTASVHISPALARLPLAGWMPIPVQSHLARARRHKKATSVMLHLWDAWEQPRWKRHIATSTFQWTCHDFSGSNPPSAARRPEQTAPGEGSRNFPLPSLQKEHEPQEPAALQ